MEEPCHNLSQTSQKEHHETVSFKDELLAMLKRAEVPYDPKYLWG